MNRLAVEVRPLAEHEIEILEAKLRRYTTETHWDRFREQQTGRTTYLVAWLGEEPAAYARIKWQPTSMMGLTLDQTPTIGDVTVRPDLRCHGIGGQLMEAAEDLVLSRGFSRLALGVEVDNPRAIDFYHARGYFDAGIPPERTAGYLLGEGELWHEGERCICLLKDLSARDAVLALARAKLNLVLHVGGRRRDGFHSVRTVIQSITLADEVTVRPAAGVTIHWAAGLEGELPGRPDLVERTLRFGHRTSRTARGLGAVVTKRIPLGAGLGGGSADAAAILKVLESLDPAFTPELLLRQARKLGADVAFCARGGLAVGTGKGDRLKPLETRPRLWWAVGIPGFTLSTEEVYRRFDSLAHGLEAEHKLGTLTGLTKALEAGDLDAIGARLQNDLEPAAFDLKPELQGLKKAMSAAGAIAAVMSGSGSAIIGLCGSEADAVSTAQKLRRVFSRVEVAASTKTGAEVVR